MTWTTIGAILSAIGVGAAATSLLRAFRDSDEGSHALVVRIGDKRIEYRDDETPQQFEDKLERALTGANPDSGR